MDPVHAQAFSLVFSSVVNFVDSVLNLNSKHEQLVCLHACVVCALVLCCAVMEKQITCIVRARS